MLCQVWQVLYSIKHRDQLRDITGDPWDGRTLEWQTASPPPFYNFAHEPVVTSRDHFWYEKQRLKKADNQKPAVASTYEPIHIA